MKTKEELEQIKAEYTELNKKLAELTEEELTQVTGGGITVDDWIVNDYEPSSDLTWGSLLHDNERTLK